MAKSKDLSFPIGTLASVFLGDDDDGDRTDFRQVPSSDTDSGYSDVGQRGSYAPNGGDPFACPDEVKWMSGYGADEADLRRGFVKPITNDDPAFDLVNYKTRSTSARVVDEDNSNTASLPTDYEFRSRNRKSRGFLTRPHIPTER